MTKEERIQKNKEFKRLSDKIEPYWDSETRELKKDTPKEIKDAFQVFLRLFDELTITDWD